MSYQLSQIYRFPVKSLRGAAHQSLAVTATGFEYDRHWMLVDPEGGFLTQRQLPRMALIGATVDHQGLVLSAPGVRDLRVFAESGAPLPVTVWQDRVTAQRVSTEADEWLSAFLQRPCHLVELPDTSVRRVNPEYAQDADRVGFADGFPFLLISEASLEDLNKRMAEPLPMERFRPNLVVSGCEPYAEDRWKRIRIGNIEFRVVKPCSRCVIPSIDPELGRSTGPEPLRTLSRYRRDGNAVYFGQNLVHEANGRLQVGDAVTVLEWR